MDRDCYCPDFTVRRPATDERWIGDHAITSLRTSRLAYSPTLLVRLRSSSYLHFVEFGYSVSFSRLDETANPEQTGRAHMRWALFCCRSYFLKRENNQAANRFTASGTIIKLAVRLATFPNVPSDSLRSCGSYDGKRLE